MNGYLATKQTVLQDGLLSRYDELPAKGYSAESEVDVARVTAGKAYRAPSIKLLGNLRQLTMGQSGVGLDSLGGSEF